MLTCLFQYGITGKILVFYINFFKYQQWIETIIWLFYDSQFQQQYNFPLTAHFLKKI
jgi:hypothetical protein